MNGMGSHQSSIMGKDEWLTPPTIVKVLGPFDLDPCSPIARPWNTARNHLTIEDNGLSCKWSGRIWLNPPYGKQTGIWLKKLADHGNGIALIFARTDTKMFFDHVWNAAGAILFIKGRLSFYHIDGKRAKDDSGAPSCLIAYGENNIESLFESGIDGYIVKLENSKVRPEQLTIVF